MRHLVVGIGGCHVLELGDAIVCAAHGAHGSEAGASCGYHGGMTDLATPLATSIAGVELSGPIVSAAGTGGSCTELADILDLRCLGAVTTKSITAESREGNQPYRVVDVPGGMLNAVGLTNKGVDAFIEQDVPKLASQPTVFIGSIAGHSIDDYVTVATAFEAVDSLPIVELNLSCPNSSSGRRFTDGPDELAEVIRATRQVLPTTKMLVKLPLLFETASDMASAAIEAGVDGLTMINTVPALSIDVKTRRPRLGYGAGGLSGPAVHTPAVGMVRRVYEDVTRDAGIPIIGLGGVQAWEHAAAFILAGATAVGIGTTLFHSPAAPRRIGRGLARWVAMHGCSSLSELIGQMDSG